jgi:protein-S-isoprenylcysteine O-methyltransferase Ste14
VRFKLPHMTDILRMILPIYFVIYFGVAFVLKSVVVAKRTGKNPFVLPKDDNIYGLVGFYFKLILTAIFVYVVVYAFFPAWHDNFLPIIQLANLTINYIGLSLLFISLVWTIIAQTHMKNSWRIGIDTETKTELITSGLFSISRNPIFFGMIITLIGVFLVTPNALTVLFLILGYILIQIQIRLEEEYLFKEHGKVYLDYKQKVRRLI